MSHYPKKQEDKLLPVPIYTGTAEQHFIGALLAKPFLLARFLDVFKIYFFEEPTHRIIYRHCIELFKQYQTFTPDTVADKLKLNSDDRMELLTYLMYCVHLCPTAECGIDMYADQVREQTAISYMKRLTREATEKLDKPEIGSEEVEQDIQKRLTELQGWKKKPTYESFREAMNTWYETSCDQIDQSKQSTPLHAFWGYQEIDEVLYGLLPGQLHIIGARPGQGKSMFALNVASNISHQGKHVLFCSLEMGKQQVMHRLISMESKIEHWKLARYKASEDELAHAGKTMNELQDLPLSFLFKGGITLQAIIDQIAYHASKNPLDVIIIDYIQLMQHTGERLYEKITMISQGLKEIAMNHNVAIIALAQLNREAANGEPQIHQLKESGSLEQDAESVILIWKPTDETKYDQKMLQVLIRKNRNGVGSTDIQLPVDYKTFTIHESL